MVSDEASHVIIATHRVHRREPSPCNESLLSVVGCKWIYSSVMLGRIYIRAGKKTKFLKKKVFTFLGF